MRTEVPTGCLYWCELPADLDNLAPIEVVIGLDVCWYRPTAWHVETLGDVDYLVVDAWEAM